MPIINLNSLEKNDKHEWKGGNLERYWYNLSEDLLDVHIFTKLKQSRG